MKDIYVVHWVISCEITHHLFVLKYFPRLGVIGLEEPMAVYWTTAVYEGSGAETSALLMSHRWMHQMLAFLSAAIISHLSMRVTRVTFEPVGYFEGRSKSVLRFCCISFSYMYRTEIQG